MRAVVLFALALVLLPEDDFAEEHFCDFAEADFAALFCVLAVAFALVFCDALFCVAEFARFCVLLLWVFCVVAIFDYSFVTGCVTVVLWNIEK